MLIGLIQMHHGNIFLCNRNIHLMQHDKIHNIRIHMHIHLPINSRKIIFIDRHSLTHHLIHQGKCFFRNRNMSSIQCLHGILLHSHIGKQWTQGKLPIIITSHNKRHTLSRCQCQFFFHFGSQRYRITKKQTDILSIYGYQFSS